MNLKDAAANLNQAHPEDTLHPLYTPWGELLMRSGSYDDILSEYPRLRRILHILPLRVSSGFLFLRKPCFPE